MSTIFSVNLVNEAKELQENIQVAEGENILDAADDQGIELPYSCRAASCFDCLGKILAGRVEQTAQALTFLKPDEIEAGYVLLCAASPASDCTILTHQVDEFLS
ncbi:MAG: 2Fe-2S iron-sulfur cluster-binding protein [Hydrococcus sp. Prado102]|jgi:ferredoxin|nr:2Fe-2S iron-sulfur cluster-binding protein [Hydrococcus sp. Prado102]